MHSKHFQDWPNNIWTFSNPLRTDRAKLMVVDSDGQSLHPTKTEISRHTIKLTFESEKTGSVLITDCMDDGLV